MTDVEKDELRKAGPVATDDIPFDPEDHEAAALRAAERNQPGSFEKATRGLTPRTRT